ncbi:MAG: hypothetical protein U0821_06860 [Chloroflexota bacterium]
MATVTIDEIFKFALSRPGSTEKGGEDILEIRFDKPGREHPMDEEFAGKVFSVDWDFGLVLILFDEAGWLQSVEIS